MAMLEPRLPGAFSSICDFPRLDNDDMVEQIAIARALVLSRLPVCDHCQSRSLCVRCGFLKLRLCWTRCYHAVCRRPKPIQRAGDARVEGIGGCAR
eukprot:1320378-Rhodomonas_salina.1